MRHHMLTSSTPQTIASGLCRRARLRDHAPPHADVIDTTTLRVRTPQCSRHALAGIAIARQVAILTIGSRPNPATGRVLKPTI